MEVLENVNWQPPLELGPGRPRRLRPSAVLWFSVATSVGAYFGFPEISRHFLQAPLLYFLILGSAVYGFELAREALLLKAGRPTVALVTDIRGTRRGRKLDYTYMAGAGQIQRRTVFVPNFRKAPAIGELTTALYWERKPSVSTLYPTSNLSLRGTKP